MRLIRVVADLPSRDPERAAGFYRELLDMKLAMSHGWIATLTSPEDESVQLSLMSEDATAPVSPAASIEVDDVDEVYAHALRMKLTIVHPLTDEPWGVRRFFVEDPDGNVVNILGHQPGRDG
jgi:catechol 2,3-dioxygenase-like lactoylglutathione lyase family enzyme